MKKSIIASVIGAAAVLTVITAIGVTTISAQLNKDESSDSWKENVSGQSESHAPTEKETIRKEIKAHYKKRFEDIISELNAKGQVKQVMFDADTQVVIEQANEAADILKKYNKLDKNFTLESIDDNVECMKAACDLLNNSGFITTREEVILELYLEENYFVLSELEGQEDLMKQIEKLVNLPY